MTKWGAALEGHTHKGAIEADQAAAQAADINGTPSFVINGYVLSGAQPYARFRQIVERALGEQSGKGDKADKADKAGKAGKGDKAVKADHGKPASPKPPAK
jgi:predicted DsbA family dithiol-disulfide isomerase